MNDITNKGPAGAIGLPADFANKLVAGLTKSKQTMAGGGAGDAIFRMQKDGVWCHGPSADEVETDSTWLMNTMSMQHGWVCWMNADVSPTGKAQKQEVMVSAFEDAPAQPAPWNGKPFVKQHSWMLKCLNGIDEGLQAIHINSSVGGGKPIDKLKDALIAQATKDPQHAFPVLKFSSDHYMHSSYGRIHTPIYQIVGWCDVNGNPAGTKAIAGAQAEAPAAAKRTRTRAAPAQQAPAAPEAPVQAPPVAAAPGPAPTQRAHTGQRRRPAAR